MTEDDDSLECAHRVPRGDYDYSELLSAPARPGAMDTEKFPSRMGSTLYFRDGRTGRVEE